MTDQQDDERRRFQSALMDAWKKVEGREFFPDLMFKRFAIGSYEIPDIESRWQGWQMARSMAPVVTEAMVARIICHYDAPSDMNSCCPVPMGEKQCQVKARAILSELHQPGSKPLSPHGERVE